MSPLSLKESTVRAVFNVISPLGAGGKNTTLCPDGDLRCVQGLVDLATWNLSIFAGRGGRPRQVPRPTLAVGEPD